MKIVSNILSKYCIACLGSTTVADSEVLSKCSRVFVIDGQRIQQSDFHGRHEINTEIFADLSQNLLAADSIHFQQLRAYILSTAVIRNIPNIVDNNKPIKIAIIGGGFAGVTAALTFMKECPDEQKISVDLYEHHKRLFPRVAGAFSRRIYPYHHLRKPNEFVSDNLQWKRSEGDTSGELGGIKDILCWDPGPIQNVLKRVEEQVDDVQKELIGNENKVLSVKCNTKVRNIKEADSSSSKPVCRIISSDFDISEQIDSISIREMDSEEEYDIVIISAGGTRDYISSIGQLNRNYWRPNTTELIAPRSVVEQIGIVGSGNTAASEVFNYAVRDDCFVELLHGIQEIANGNEKLSGFLNIDLNEISVEKFNESFESSGFKKYTAENKNFLRKILESKDKIRVTLFAENTQTNVFATMNPINKFLMLFLNSMGQVVIRDLNIELEKYKQRLPALKEDAEKFSIDVDNDMYNFKYKGMPVRPKWSDIIQGKNQYCWSGIYKCIGTKRFYHEVFSGHIGTITQAGDSYRVIDDEGEKRIANTISYLIKNKIDELA